MRDNFRTEVGPGAARGGQLTLKDYSDAKIPKGPKIKEKNLESYKAEPSEKAKESNKTKKIFPAFGIASNLSKTLLQKHSAVKHVTEFKEKLNPDKLASSDKIKTKASYLKKTGI